MQKIAILYICTGKYTVFWERFYTSFERYFLPMTEKHYYVFGDDQVLYQENENPRIHKQRIEHLPWPLPTLLRFWFFSSIREELLGYDYICLMNSNVVCQDFVYEADYLPRAEMGENLMFTQHPGYENQNPVYFPYERRKQCLAYIPYHKGTRYVFGAMNGGTAKAYMDMIEELNKAAVNDLKNGLIAKCHDESYINAYVEKRSDYRVLSTLYCYPEGWEKEAECKILGLDKSKVIAVDKIKAVVPESAGKRSFRQKIGGRLHMCCEKWYPRIKKLTGQLGERMHG